MVVSKPWGEVVGNPLRTSTESLTDSKVADTELALRLEIVFSEAGSSVFVDWHLLKSISSAPTDAEAWAAIFSNICISGDAPWVLDKGMLWL